MAKVDQKWHLLGLKTVIKTWNNNCVSEIPFAFLDLSKYLQWISGIVKD
jgi:hypothetical protein